MAFEEIDVSMKAAEHHLREARGALRRGVFFDCVFHSASAAENAANAPILHLGGVIPRTHRNADAMREAALERRPRLLKEGDFKSLLKKVAALGSVSNSGDDFC